MALFRIARETATEQYERKHRKREAKEARKSADRRVRYHRRVAKDRRRLGG